MLKVSKYPALSFMTPAIENIKQYLSNYQPKNDVIQHLKDNILDNIKKNFGLPSTLGLYRSFFDPRFKNLLYINNELCHEIINNLREQYTKLSEPIQIKKEDSKILSFFQSFKTNIISNIENSNEITGITVFIPNGFLPVLVQSNETVNLQNMIKELPKLKIKIPAWVLNTAGIDQSLNEKVTKKAPNCFMLFQKDMCHIVKAYYQHLSNHEVSILIAKLWKQVNDEIKDEYRKQAQEIQKEYQKRNADNRVKYIYKRKLPEEKVHHKRNKYTDNQISELRDQIGFDSNSKENNDELQNKLKNILDLSLDNTIISKKTNEKNNVKTYSEESENKEVSFAYPQEFDLSLQSGYNLFGNQFSFTDFGYETENFEDPYNNPYASITTNKVEDSNELISYEKKFTEKLADESELMDMLTTESKESPFNSEQSSKKIANLDIESLMSIITKNRAG
ncbi:22814_t:CDS:2 [Racocetra persica]|uniref:22814_t:CDS:1 n=1 Tax=Racocetra persica TaxID=160502 RepID=A0ACA9KQ60_9GLOM|nr:22814_t:CDS:2 [Racocetra persica]